MQLPEIMSFFIPSAEAATPAVQPAGGGSSFMIMTGALIFMMYFMIWRPQNRRAREQRDLMSALTQGDEVITAGGILGTITKVMDGYIRLSPANGVEMIIQKSSVTGLLPKGTLKTI